MPPQGQWPKQDLVWEQITAKEPKEAELWVFNSHPRPQGVGLYFPVITGSCDGQWSPSHASGAPPSMRVRS